MIVSLETSGGFAMIGLRALLSASLAGAVPAVAAVPSETNRVLADIGVAPKSAAEVRMRCDRGLAAAERAKTALEAMPRGADKLAALRAYDDLYNLTFTLASGEAYLIQETNPDGAIRAAAEDCVKRGSTLATKIGMSRPIYERLQATQKAGVAPELRYMLTRQIDNYRRGGVDKDERTRRRIAALQDEITATNLELQKNIRDDIRIVKARPDELAMLPKDFLDTHKPGSDGLITLKTTAADFTPVIQYSSSEDLRKQMVTAWNNRAHPANDAVLKKLFAQRQELAGLLGFPSYAALDIANRMARDPGRTQKFIDEIAAAARPAGEKDAARMLARLRKDDPKVEQLGAWSTSYAAGLIRKEDYQVDPALVRQYFSYDKVQAGIFKLTEDLFQVRIRPWNTAVWSPDVQAFEMVENGKPIGRFYLDMHPRENKYTHAAMFPVRIGIKDRSLPVAALLANVPTGLLEHAHVETFLHEFGHLLHWMFAGQREWAAQNFAEVENDVTEAPSTLLEEWVWDYDTLSKFATNEAGEVIPRPLVAKMNAGRRFGQAFATMTQLGLSAASMNYYMFDMKDKDVGETFDRSYYKYALSRYPTGSNMASSFGHLGSYGASYYTYQWSEALAADLFSRFRKEGMRNPATAKAYRDLILAPGGSESMNVLAKRFLGRDWSVDSYRRELETSVK
jgi:thimet oligopeptidase